jgi:hypothetical protein
MLWWYYLLSESPGEPEASPKATFVYEQCEPCCQEKRAKRYPINNEFRRQGHSGHRQNECRCDGCRAAKRGFHRQRFAKDPVRYAEQKDAFDDNSEAPSNCGSLNAKMFRENPHADKVKRQFEQVELAGDVSSPRALD